MNSIFQFLTKNSLKRKSWDIKRVIIAFISVIFIIRTFTWWKKIFFGHKPCKNIVAFSGGKSMYTTLAGNGQVECTYLTPRKEDKFVLGYWIIIIDFFSQTIYINHLFLFSLQASMIWTIHSFIPCLVSSLPDWDTIYTIYEIFKKYAELTNIPNFYLEHKVSSSEVSNCTRKTCPAPHKTKEKRSFSRAEFFHYLPKPLD